MTHVGKFATELVSLGLINSTPFRNVSVLFLKKKQRQRSKCQKITIKNHSCPKNYFCKSRRDREQQGNVQERLWKSILKKYETLLGVEAKAQGHMRKFLS